MAESKMQLEDWLDDLCVRFIIHLPKEDLSSVARICFQVEEAQWFYEDFIRPLDPALPSMSLRSFCLRIFQHCPLLAPFSVENHTRAFEEFLQYKTRVPVRGAILLNAAMDSTVLVKGWKKSASWSFPRGKINKDEDDLDCAIREVYEETGFDIREAGLVPKDDEVKYIQISMREQQIRLYVFRNIPMDTVFEPKTRKEISKVQWYKLSELPAFRKKGNDQDDAPAAPNASKFYMVAPFLVPLKKWVVRQTKKDAARAAASSSQLGVQAPAEEPLTEDDIGAQTEPVAAASNGTPAIETLEGANLELQRLLQARPPTQGLQVNPSTASNPSKGEALMALLQKRDVGAPFQQAQQPDPHVPHTPFDHIYSSAPEPHTPHHHHPTQRLPVTNSQPPPNFPTLPGTTHHVSSGFFNQARAQALPQVYGRNPFSDPAAPMPQKEPVLLHPQPLPPQVQQSLLTRGILPTPGLPDTAGQGGLQAQEKGPNPFMARRNDAYAPQQPVKPTQLSGHAVRLLDAFKASARDPHENQPPVKAPEGSASLQGRHQPAVPSSVPAAAQSFNPAAQYLPHHMVLGATQPPQAAAPMPKPAQPTDSHRSALLDIFKRSGPRSPLSNEITARSGRAQDSVGFAKQEEPGSPASKAPSAAEAIASASEANGAPVQMNPDVTLPYRAVQILSRPRQADQARSQDFASTQAQMQRLQQRLSPRGPARHELGSTACPGPPSPRDRALLHQREQAAERSPQLNYAAAQAASLPYARPAPQSPSSAYGVPPFHQPQPTGGVQRHKEANPEQRQKLLSLFGKEQPSPTGLAADYKGKAVERVVSEQPRSGTPRFRGASFASTGAAEPATGSSSTSRRGSQTPISPANRSFLLSYLESVSNSAR